MPSQQGSSRTVSPTIWEASGKVRETERSLPRSSSRLTSAKEVPHSSKPRSKIRVTSSLVMLRFGSRLSSAAIS